MKNQPILVANTSNGKQYDITTLMEMLDTDFRTVQEVEKSLADVFRFVAIYIPIDEVPPQDYNQTLVLLEAFRKAFGGVKELVVK